MVLPRKGSATGCAAAAATIAGAIIAGRTRASARAPARTSLPIDVGSFIASHLPGRRLDRKASPWAERRKWLAARARESSTVILRCEQRSQAWVFASLAGSAAPDTRLHRGGRPPRLAS